MSLKQENLKEEVVQQIQELYKLNLSSYATQIDLASTHQADEINDLGCGAYGCVLNGFFSMNQSPLFGVSILKIQKFVFDASSTLDHFREILIHKILSRIYSLGVSYFYGFDVWSELPPNFEESKQNFSFEIQDYLKIDENPKLVTLQTTGFITLKSFWILLQNEIGSSHPSLLLQISGKTTYIYRQSYVQFVRTILFQLLWSLYQYYELFEFEHLGLKPDNVILTNLQNFLTLIHNSDNKEEIGDKKEEFMSGNCNMKKIAYLWENPRTKAKEMWSIETCIQAQLIDFGSSNIHFKESPPFVSQETSNHYSHPLRRTYESNDIDTKKKQKHKQKQKGKESRFFSLYSLEIFTVGYFLLEFVFLDPNPYVQGNVKQLYEQYIPNKNKSRTFILLLSAIFNELWTKATETNPYNWVHINFKHLNVDYDDIALVEYFIMHRLFNLEMRRRGKDKLLSNKELKSVLEKFQVNPRHIEMFTSTPMSQVLIQMQKYTEKNEQKPYLTQICEKIKKIVFDSMGPETVSFLNFLLTWRIEQLTIENIFLHPFFESFQTKTSDDKGKNVFWNCFNDDPDSESEYNSTNIAIAKKENYNCVLRFILNIEQSNELILSKQTGFRTKLMYSKKDRKEIQNLIHSREILMETKTLVEDLTKLAYQKKITVAESKDLKSMQQQIVKVLLMTKTKKKKNFKQRQKEKETEQIKQLQLKPKKTPKDRERLKYFQQPLALQVSETNELENSPKKKSQSKSKPKSKKKALKQQPKPKKQISKEGY